MYLIIRRELMGKLSYSLWDCAPYYDGLDQQWRRKSELVFELTPHGNTMSLTRLRAMCQSGTIYPSPFVKRVVNIPEALSPAECVVEPAEGDRGGNEAVSGAGTGSETGAMQVSGKEPLLP